MQFYLMFADREQAEMCLDSFLEEDNNSWSRRGLPHNKSGENIANDGGGRQSQCH